MQKPPPLFRPLESLRFAATPRMFRGLLVLALAVLIPTGADKVLRPDPPRVGPIPLPVPAQERTTRITEWPTALDVLGIIPEPGPNQVRAGKCNAKRSEVAINGGCWVRTDHPKPCPEGYQWENVKDGRCYLPVAEAKPAPRSGDPQMVNIAGEP